MPGRKPVRKGPALKPVEIRLKPIELRLSKPKPVEKPVEIRLSKLLADRMKLYEQKGFFKEKRLKGLTYFIEKQGLGKEFVTCINLAGGERVSMALNLAGGERVGNVLRLAGGTRFGNALLLAGGEQVSRALLLAGGEAFGAALRKNFNETVESIRRREQWKTLE